MIRKSQKFFLQRPTVQLFPEPGKNHDLSTFTFLMGFQSIFFPYLKCSTA